MTTARVRVIAIVAAMALVSISGVQAAHAAGGHQLWASTFVGPAWSVDRVSALAVSPDGTRVFIMGDLTDPNTTWYQTVAYDASTGAQLWAKRYDGPVDGFARASALGVSPDGSKVFVTGATYGTTTSLDYATVAYDAATGARLWTRRYTSSFDISHDEATALGVNPDGSAVFVTGTSYAAADGTDYVTVAYSTATGKRLWTARYDGASSNDSARALAVSPDASSVIVTGSSGGDYATVAYNPSTGATRWVRRYDGPRGLEDQANALSVSPDGARVFVTGFSDGSNRKRDFATVAYNSLTGTEKWVQRYNGPGDWNDNGKAVGVSPDGSRVFVTGYRTGHDYRDVETIAYDAASGARLWLRAYKGPDDMDDQGTALGVSPDGQRVFVTGFSRSSATNKDYVTLAYGAATGKARWQTLYDGSVDVAYALGVSPDGSKVFVAGMSGYDYATLAYSAT